MILTMRKTADTRQALTFTSRSMGTEGREQAIAHFI